MLFIGEEGAIVTQNPALTQRLYFEDMHITNVIFLPAACFIITVH